MFANIASLLVFTVCQNIPLGVSSPHRVKADLYVSQRPKKSFTYGNNKQQQYVCLEWDSVYRSYCGLRWHVQKHFNPICILMAFPTQINAISTGLDEQNFSA